MYKEIFLGFIVDKYFQLAYIVFCLGNNDEVVRRKDFELLSLESFIVLKCHSAYILFMRNS